MPNYYSEEIYEGPEAIVVAMDIGTTQSAVSFAHFSPGKKPQGKMVAHWPGLAHWSSAAKTPSIVSYSGGKPKACGAEALGDLDGNRGDVAYWFKLHLHPPEMSLSQNFKIPPLPTGITIERVYADIMKYLMENTQRFFEETTPNGAEIWARVRDTIFTVLATPNGWQLREQATLRDAAIMSSLVTEENAGNLLQFVTESEASVHYAIFQGSEGWLKEGSVFAVVDCGGSTVDTTVYRCTSTNPLSLTETCPSECVQAGGIFVNREAERLLNRRLDGSSFGHPDIIKSMVDAFEKELKPQFDGAEETYDLRFGVRKDNDPELGISKGRIAFSGEELKSIFDEVVNRIVQSSLSVIVRQKAEHVLLVGGFAESPYLRKILRTTLRQHKIDLITVGDYANKAAAEGAIIGHIKHFVIARAARATFGGCGRVPYKKKIHRERKHTIEVDADGKKRVGGAFHPWITKGTVVKGTFAHKLPYQLSWDSTSTSKDQLGGRLGMIKVEVFAWENDGIPTWCLDEQGVAMKNMRLICTLNADLSTLAAALKIQTGSRGTRFYRVDYDVCVYFGGTQLRASLQWKEKGVLCEGPIAVLAYNPYIRADH